MKYTISDSPGIIKVEYELHFHPHETSYQSFSVTKYPNSNKFQVIISENTKSNENGIGTGCGRVLEVHETNEEFRSFVKELYELVIENK